MLRSLVGSEMCIRDRYKAESDVISDSASTAAPANGLDDAADPYTTRARLDDSSWWQVDEIRAERMKPGEGSQSTNYKPSETRKRYSRRQKWEDTKGRFYNKDNGKRYERLYKDDVYDDDMIAADGSLWPNEGLSLIHI